MLTAILNNYMVGEMTALKISTTYEYLKLSRGGMQNTFDVLGKEIQDYFDNVPGIITIPRINILILMMEGLEILTPSGGSIDKFVTDKHNKVWSLINMYPLFKEVNDEYDNTFMNTMIDGCIEIGYICEEVTIDTNHAFMMLTELEKILIYHRRTDLFMEFADCMDDIMNFKKHTFSEELKMIYNNLMTKYIALSGGVII